MKRVQLRLTAAVFDQPPSGGCVLKRHWWAGVSGLDGQPPSGGCVLKLDDFEVAITKT